MSAPRCSCGYLFEVDHGGDDTHAVELEAQQERIYLDYLAARTAQAEEAYRVAKRHLEADPESVVKSADVLVAQQQMHVARTELAAQTVKTRVAMARAMELRKSKPAPVLVKTREPAAPQRRASKAPKAAPSTALTDRAPAPAPGGSDPAAKASPQGAAAAPAPASPPGATPEASDQRSAPAALATTRAAPDTPKPSAVVLPEPPTGPTVATAPGAVDQRSDPPGKPAAAAAAVTVKAAPPTPTSARRAPDASVAAPSPAPAAKKPTPRPTPAVTNPGAARPSAQPTSAFREAQAAKAKDIVARRKDTNAVTTRAKAPAVPRPAPRQPAVRAAEETKDCPSCTATVAFVVRRCRCGFIFSNGVELPGVVLTPAERTALLQGFDISPNPRKPA